MSKAEEYLVNDKYRLLKMMSENETHVKNAKFVKLTQQDMSDMMSFAKVKVNAIIRDLKEAGYIVAVGRGKYTLTKEGRRAIEIISNL